MTPRYERLLLWLAMLALSCVWWVGFDVITRWIWDMLAG